MAMLGAVTSPLSSAVPANWTGPRLIYVRPRLDGFSTFDFAQNAYFLQEGYRATAEALKQANLGDVRDASVAS